MSDAVLRAGREDRRRLPILGSVLALLALGGIGNAFVRHRQSLSLTNESSSPSAALVSSAASSSAWYCPGPLPIGNREEASSVAIANVANRAVSGELVVTDSNGAVTRRSIAVAAGAQVVIGLPRDGSRRFASVTVLAEGSGIGVEQLVHSSFGADSAPCVSHTTPTEYLPAGSTKGANDLTLAILDPGATPAVANVSFATPTGIEQPSAFQGIPVGSGQLVVLNVGHYLPSRQVIATTVTAAGGRIVAGTYSAATVGSTLTYSLMSGVAVASPSWYLASTPSGPGVRQSFSLYDPNSTDARVLVHLVGPSGTSTYPVVVPAGRVAVFSPAPDPGESAMRYAVIETAADTPVLLARSTALAAATVASSTPVGTPAAGKAKGAPIVGAIPLPLLSAGYGLTAPAITPTQRWLLPGGEVDSRTDELITIANPGAKAVTARLHELRAAALSSGEITGPRGVVVPAHGSVVIDAGRHLVKRDALAITVDATGPVVVGGVLYARVSKGSLGFSAPVAIPVA